MKIIHHNDIDGRSSAFIVKKALDENKLETEKNYFVKFIEMNYDIPFPIETILDNEYIIIVDFSVFPEMMNKILKKTQNVIWIDHHISAIDKYKDYANRDKLKGIQFEDDDNLISGAALTYLYFFENCRTKEDCIEKFNKVPYYIQLISDYDTFAKKLYPQSYYFKLYLESKKNTPEAKLWKDILELKKHDIEDLCEDGKVIDTYLKETNEDLNRQTGFERTVDGYNAFILNTNRRGSQLFNELYEKYDICIICYYNGKKWLYGLYTSKDNVDVSKIAQKYNGGGHKGAAGFNSDKFLF